MEDIQNIWNKTKKTLKFIWRHFLTLGMLGFLFSILIKSPLNWENAFYTMCVCIVLDWGKQFFKLTPNPSRSHYSHEGSHVLPRNALGDQWWNPHVMGTPASMMRDNHYR